MPKLNKDSIAEETLAEVKAASKASGTSKVKESTKDKSTPKTANTTKSKSASKVKGAAKSEATSDAAGDTAKVVEKETSAKKKTAPSKKKTEASKSLAETAELANDATNVGVASDVTNDSVDTPTINDITDGTSNTTVESSSQNDTGVQSKEVTQKVLTFLKKHKASYIPVVVLVAITLVITVALAITNSITDPIIAENSQATAEAARKELLPDADSFKAFDGDLIVLEEGAVFVTECFVAENGTGMVVTVSTKSFGGPMIQMVGIDPEGAILGIKVTEHADTPGLGTKAQDEENYLPQYIGITELLSNKAKDEQSITHVAGATVTSDALHYGVRAALEQYKIAGGSQ